MKNYNRLKIFRRTKSGTTMRYYAAALDREKFLKVINGMSFDEGDDIEL